MRLVYSRGKMHHFKRFVLFIFLFCLITIIIFAAMFEKFQTNHIKENAPLAPTSQRNLLPLPNPSSDQSMLSEFALKVSQKLEATKYKKPMSAEDPTLEQLLRDLDPKFPASWSHRQSWDLAERWITPRKITPESAPQLGSVLNSLSSARITTADVALRGTQLKILLMLEGNQLALFKPMRYPRDHVVTGLPYAGADRHNGEIAAFHLNRLLGFNRTPLVASRILDLEEIKKVAKDRLAETFLTRGKDTCFYGQCVYCSSKDPVCGNGTRLEGAVVLWLPLSTKLKKLRHPWQRTYNEKKLARWEKDPYFCRRKPKPSQLADLIDTAIFDYLIGNADRHHYETFADHYPSSTVLLLDNGKSFGNPYTDYLSILAPLYQCCQVRNSSFQRLLALRGRLGQSLSRLMAKDPVAPVLTTKHLEALDRRLLTVLATVSVCADLHQWKKVLLPDPIIS